MISEAIQKGGLTKAFPGRQWSYDPAQEDVEAIVWHDGPPPPSTDVIAALTAFMQVNPAQEDILALERTQRAKTTDRADREFRIGVFEAIAALQATIQQVPVETVLATLRSKNAGYKALKDIDDAIVELRKQR